jgi:hypothetical protein
MLKHVSNAENGSESGARPDSPSPSLTKFEGWKPSVISRTEIKNAAYNPRTITEQAKKRLREAISRVGLVQPIVWNRRTGNIVGGHQRIAQIDSLEGRKDYLITVAEVDVNDVRERELNVLLNNAEVQGDWDLDSLKALLATDGLEAANAGFGAADIMQLFGEAAQQTSDADQELAASLAKVKESYTKLTASMEAEDEMEFYCVAVFRSDAERLAFLQSLQLPDNRYVNGDFLSSRVIPVKQQVEEPKPADTGDGAVELDGVA